MRWVLKSWVSTKQIRVYQHEKGSEKVGENRGKFYSSPTVSQRVCRLFLCRPHTPACTVAQDSHGKSINLTAKRKILRAKRITSRLKEKDSRQKHENNLECTAKEIRIKMSSRHRRDFVVSLSFCREVIPFAASLFLFAVRLFFLPWDFSFCREVILFDVKYIWNNSYLNCGCRWKWRMIIGVNFPV